MLDEAEYADVRRLYVECMNNVKTYRKENSAMLADSPVDELFKPVCDWYHQKTGAMKFHQDAIMHHRISSYGNQCRSCGKPLRTPRASFCAECGTAI